MYSPTQVDMHAYDGDARGNPRDNAGDVGKDEHPSAQDAPGQSGARVDARADAYVAVDDVIAAIIFVPYHLHTVQQPLIPGPRPTTHLPLTQGHISRTVRLKPGTY